MGGTTYQVVEIELGGKRLLRDRGVVHVCDVEVAAWHAIIYEVGAVAARGLAAHLPLRFVALDRDGSELSGWVSVVEHDEQTATLYVEGSGALSMRDSAGSPTGRHSGRSLGGARRLLSAVWGRRQSSTERTPIPDTSREEVGDRGAGGAVRREDDDSGEPHATRLA